VGQSVLPYIINKGTTSQLIINEKPYLILGGELGNSSASSITYMNSIWPTLEQMNLNTLLVPVYWELLEPQEGKFDFTLVDQLVSDAQSRNLKLILLWFGSWKNSMSCYVPPWVKTNQTRFPRAKNKNGESVEILSPFNSENLNADKKAFIQLMKHIKEIDAQGKTVIMVQVENEIGMLPDARDYSPEATKQFNQNIPEQLSSLLKQHSKNLSPQFYSIWQQAGKKTNGTWSEVFGNTLAAEEIFMAWHFALYTEEITKAGKAIHNLPMFINAALNRIGYEPGEYPSAGPLPHLMDVWRTGAPSIDFLAPDIYFPDFKHWVNLYHTAENPLFIPEARFEPSVGAKMFYAMGKHHAMGFSPFSIESTQNPTNESIVKAYNLIEQITPFIIEHQGTANMTGFMLSKVDNTDTLSIGGYTFIVKHDYTLGWSPEAKKEEWPFAGGIIISIATGEYLIAGNGFIITFISNDKNIPQVGIEIADEGVFENEKWIPQRRMNGDQTHQGRHIRIPMDDYSIQKFKLYSFK
jgi:beta-galactosidase GanA